MKVTDIMTKDAITVKQDDSVLLAADLLAQHSFPGLPVVDNTNTLVGLVSQSDLVTKSSHVHIPTILALFQKFDLYRKDKKFATRQLERINQMKISEIMNLEPPLIHEGAGEDALVLLLSRIHGVGPVSVVNSKRELKGVVTRADIVKVYHQASSLPIQPIPPSRIDSDVDSFLNEFEGDFLFISRARTRAWLMLNLSFVILGIIIALLLFW
jgi:acetoin utilization protein AcuB